MVTAELVGRVGRRVCVTIECDRLGVVWVLTPFEAAVVCASRCCVNKGQASSVQDQHPQNQKEHHTNPPAASPSP